MRRRSLVTIGLSIWLIASLLLADVARATRPPAGRQANPAGAVALPLASGTSFPARPPEDSQQDGTQPIPPRTRLAGRTQHLGLGLSANGGSGAVAYQPFALSVPGRGPLLQVALQYHSLYRQTDNGWGYGWSFGYDWRYEEEPGGDVTVVLNRSSLAFASDGQGGYVSPSPGVTLTRQAEALLLDWADGRQMTFGSTAHRRATRYQDADGRALALAYDGAGHPTAITDDQGRQIALAYDSGRLQIVSDWQIDPPRQVQLGYDPAGDLVSVTDGLGQATALAYDDEHRLVGVADPRGGATTLTYDGDYVTQVERGGLVTALEADETAGTITVRQTDGGGAVRQWVTWHDYAGSPIGTTFPDNSSTAQEWDEVQRQFITTDENGGATVLQFDAAGDRLLTATDPLGHTTSYTYHPTLDLVSAVTDPLGRTTAYQYDAGGRMTATIDPLGGRMGLTRDPQGELVGLTDALTHTIRMAYDGAGSMTTITNPLGATWRTAYDLAGNVVSQTDGLGHTLTAAYDALGQPIVITGTLGYALTMAYDANGNLVRTADPNGRATAYGYDALDRLTTITDTLGNVTRLGYDRWGNPTTLTDTLGHAFAYTYDARDRMTGETDPLGQTTTYRYDPAGNLVAAGTDARGQVVTYTYDAANQLTAADYPGDDDAYWLFDPAGQVVFAGDADLELAYGYDATGRLAGVTAAFDGVTFAPVTLSYGYDPAGQLITTTYPGGPTLTTSYDAAGRMIGLAGGGLTYLWAYDAADRPVQVAPAAGAAGVQTALEYDAADRTTALSHASPAGAVVFEALSYAYDPAGNVLTATRNGEITAYAYDPLYRLTEVTYPGGSWERTRYDPTGNRLELNTPAGSVQYAYDAADQLVVMTDTRGGPPAVTAFTYDENGAMHSRASGGQTTWYTWDASGNLRRVDLADGRHVAYGYGPDGQRVWQRGADGATVYYVYDGLNLIQERTAGGDVLASYTYGPEVDRPLSMTRGGETTYYLYDRLGSVIGLTDGAGALVARYHYDPWGNLLSQSGSVENPFRFTGREWDDETGLAYHRARYYDPALGRFLSRDPLGPRDGANRYLYAGNNPVNYVDQSGASRCTAGEECRGFCKCFNECYGKASSRLRVRIAEWLSTAMTVANLAKTVLLKTRELQKLMEIQGVKTSLRDLLRGKTGNVHLDVFGGTGLRVMPPLKQETSVLNLGTILDSIQVGASNVNEFLGIIGFQMDDDNCVDTAWKVGLDLLDKAAGIFGAIEQLVAGCTAALATEGAAAGLCAWALAGGGVQGWTTGAFVGNVSKCSAEAQVCRDRQKPLPIVAALECNQYHVSFYDNCELVGDSERDVWASSQPQTVEAVDKEGNRGYAVVPACSADCELPPICIGTCLEPEWQQSTCKWECVSQQDRRPYCPDCMTSTFDLNTCTWEPCRSKPALCGPSNIGRSGAADSCPPACASDLCGNPRFAAWDGCGWRCPQVNTNNPCLPDENRSPAGPEAPAAPAVTAALLSPAAAGRIAILDNGFALWLEGALAKQGVRAERVPAEFSPEMVDRYPALVIPSGGLSGYAGSELMRQRLARYAQNGGLIVALAQEHGAEWALLPGGVTGYGYDEDVNCQADSAYLSGFAPMLAGQTAETLSLNIDGFFTNWPAGTTVLLGRRANGMPAMLSYPAGAGRVLVTGAYPDMAAYQGQGTPDEAVLLRDLARWALAAADPPMTADTYGPHDGVTVTLTVTNTGDATAAALGFEWRDPWDRPAGSGELALATPLAPGAATQVTLTLDLDALALPPADRYGLWSVDLALLEGDGKGAGTSPLPAAYPDAALFAVTAFVAAGDGYGYPGKPFALSVTSDTEAYPYGSPALFTYHVFNHSDQPTKFTVGWWLIHHMWNNVPEWQGSRPVTVPAHSSGIVTSTLERVVDLDRVRATLSAEGLGQVAYAERGFWVKPARIEQTVTADRAVYDWLETPTVTVTARCLSDVPLDVNARLELQLPGGGAVEADTRAFTLAAGAVQTYTVALPPLERAGNYRVMLSSQANNRATANPAEARFTLPPPHPDLDLPLPERIGAGAPLTASVTNLGVASLPTSTLTVTLVDPAGGTVWSAAAELPWLAPGEVARPVLTQGDPAPVVLGDYALLYRLTYAGGILVQGQLRAPSRLAISGEFDRTTYRVRETLRFTATLANRGLLDLAPAVTLTIPALGLTHTQTISLPGGASSTVTVSGTLPADLPAGSYPVEVVAGLPGVPSSTRGQGSAVSRSFSFVVPAAALQASLSPGPCAAGDTLTVTLRNAGGVDAAAGYERRLTGGAVAVAQDAGSVALPAGGSVDLPLSVPEQAAGGMQYALTVSAAVQDAECGKSYRWDWPLSLTGVGAALSARPGRPAYLAGETVVVTGAVTVTAGSLISAPLALTVANDAPGGPWEVSPSERVDDHRGNLVLQDPPAMAVDAAGNAYALWSDDTGGVFAGPGGVFFAFRPVAGEWGASERVNDDSTADWGVALAVDSGGNVHALWTDVRSGLAEIYADYRPAGGGWGQDQRLGDGTAVNRVAPDVAVDQDGNAYAVWRDDRWNTDIYFSERPAGGSWGTAVPLPNASDPASFETEPAVAVSPAGTVHVIWVLNTYNIYSAFRPAGQGWQGLARVNDNWPPFVDYMWGPDIAVDAGGNAIAIWTDTRGDAIRLSSAVRPLNAGAFGANQAVTENLINGLDGKVAVDAAGNAWAAWHQYKPANDEYDVWAAYRPAGGSWGAAEQVSDPDAADNQLYPVIGVDSAGNVFAAWQDGRNSASGLPDKDVFFSYRPSAGLWEADQQVDDAGHLAVQWDPDIDLDAVGNATAAWMDNRDGHWHIRAATRPADGSWESSEQVDDSTDLRDNTYPPPSLAVDVNGNAYAVWAAYLYDQDRDFVFFDRRPAGGGWGSDEQIEYDAGTYRDEPRIGVDAAGNAYVVWNDDRAGDSDVHFAYRPAAGGWTAAVQVNDDVTSFPQQSPDMAVTGNGDAYAVWADYRSGEAEIFFAYRPAGGGWGPNQRVHTVGGIEAHEPAVAVDAAGTAYAVWDSGWPTFEIMFSSRPAGGAWSAAQPVPAAVGSAPSIAVSPAGDVAVSWQQETEGYDTLFLAHRPAGGSWQPPLRVVDADAGAINGSLAIGPDGAANAVWEQYGQVDSDIYFATAGSPGGGVVWSRTELVTTGDRWPVAVSAGTLDEIPGRYRLDARLRNSLGQTLARDGATFYIHPAGVALTLETDRDAYRLGQTVWVSGRVTNTAVLTAAVPLTVTANSAVLLTGTLTLGPDQGAAYTTTMTAAADVLLLASAGAAEVGRQITVGEPAVEAALAVPEVAGRAPFSATLSLTNTGAIPLELAVDFGGQATAAAGLEIGESAQLLASLVITQDTWLTVTVSGDVVLTLTQHITQGEVVSLAWDPPAGDVWAGPLALPYTLTNAGLLPSAVPLEFTLDGAPLWAQALTLLAGTEHTGLLWLDNPAGTHTLTATIPGQQLTASWTAWAPDTQAVTIDDLQAPAWLAEPTVVTVTLTNHGLGAVVGTVRAETSFFLDEIPFQLAVAETAAFTTTLTSEAAPGDGTYTLTVTAMANGAELDRAQQSITLFGPDVQGEVSPITLRPGEGTAVPVTLTNWGGVGGPYTVTLDLHGLYAADQQGWLASGDAVTLTYAITVPADLEAETRVGHLAVNGLETPFTYTVAGLQLDMGGQLSPRLASAGEAMTVTIRISDTSGLGAPLPLRVRLSGAGEPQTRTVTLTHTALVTFSLAAPAESALLSYGVYHPDGRSLLLDTLRLTVMGDLVGVYPDQDRYQAGETVRKPAGETATLTAMAAYSGTLSWQVLEQTGVLTLTPSLPVTWTVSLPADLPAGTYYAWTLFEVDEGIWQEDKTPFEVEGDRVSVRQVDVGASPWDDGQALLEVRMQVQSRTPLDDVGLTFQVVGPDGAQLLQWTQSVDLPEGPSWIESPLWSFSPQQSGTHRLRYRLTHAGREMATGWHAFDLPGPAILGLQPARDYFLITQPITLTAALLNEGTPPFTLALALDGVPAAEQQLPEEGYQVATHSLNPLPLGVYTVTARLTDAEGRSSQQEVAVQVVRLGVQLDLPEPTGLLGWHVVTPTIWLWPEVPASIATYAWDGGGSAPAAAGRVAAPADGHHALLAWAELRDGTAGAAVTATLALDRAAPEVLAQVQPGTPVTLTLAVTDTASGPGWAATWSDGAWVTYTAPLVFASGRATTVLYQAIDQAGNPSGIRQIQVPPVAQPYRMALGAQVVRQQGAPGGSLPFSLRLANAGVSADSYTVTLRGHAWPAQAPADVGPLDPGQSKRVTVVMAVPPGATGGESDTVTVTVTSTGDPSQAAGVALTAEAQVSHGVGLAAGRLARAAAPGGLAVYRLRLTNRGNTADTFDLAVSGHYWPVTLPSTVGPLPAGAYADLEVTVAVPPGALPGQEDQAMVTAKSRGDPGAMAAVALTTTCVSQPAGPSSGHQVYLPLVLRR